MSGDVFGNGMLQSRHIRLLAAFNHLHIFVDPDPDPAASFAERQRLFALPRSSWADYDPTLISPAAASSSAAPNRSRSAPEMKRVFDIAEDHLTPAELIRKLADRRGRSAVVRRHRHLRQGAATKPTPRSATAPTTRCAIDGEEIRAKVVGEGANLGVTQRGRVAYALKGGRIDTDAIDNSAGVDTSDHEVNIKILLGSAIAAGALGRQERDPLLGADDRRCRRAGAARQLSAGRGAVGRRGARRRPRSTARRG